MKKLSAILTELDNKNIHLNWKKSDLNIEHISYDSKDIKENTLFFCKGAHFKKEYLQEAIKNGAIAYISEVDYEVSITAILVDDIRLSILYTAAFFYDYPDQKLTLIGVSGTKGKSTTVTFIKSVFDEYLLKNNQKPCGIISTIQTYDGIDEYESTLTTPEAFDLYRNLHNAVISGLKYMVIEVSSQALKYNRITTVKFDSVALLNIGKDHISPIEHPTFKDYVQSKLKLFNLASHAIINDDIQYRYDINKIIENNGNRVETFSLINENSTIYTSEIVSFKDRVEFVVDKEKYQLPMLGNHNIENALCTILIARHYGIDTESIQEGLKKVHVKGRFNLYITDDEKIVIMVDYAHNDLSFEKFYELANDNFKDYKIVSIFGASGKKSLNRREDLTRVASVNSDFIYFVPDDPGYEDFQDISHEMVSFIENNCPYKILSSREEATREAFKLATEKTLLFVAGKGDEHYQFIDGKYVEINSDVSVASDLVETYNQLLKG